MSATAIEIIIGCATFFLTTLANAVVIGMFLGSLNTKVQLMSDRLAKIEGMFTLVPRGDGNGTQNDRINVGRNSYRTPSSRSRYRRLY